MNVVVRETQRLLDDVQACKLMARGVSPYGDGKAANRIVGILRQSLESEVVTDETAGVI